MSNIQLRPYQQQFIDNVREQFRLGHKRVVGVAPCGAGKTIITGWMILQALRRNKHSIFFVHRHELIEQTANTFVKLDIPFGIIASGFPMKLDLPVQIASVQTLARRLDKIPQPDFLICDECHHILANTYKKILDKFKDAFLLGVTATPIRMGGITLHDSFDSMVISLSVNQLINLGNLTKFHYFVPKSDINLHNVKSVHGDFDNNQLEQLMLKPSITGDIVDNYINFANGLQAICYCVNVKHSKAVAEAFNLAGIVATHCDGDTNNSLRSQIVTDFRNHKIKVLCNAELFGEGFDVPACQAVILARPTMSLSLFIQQAMRPLRPNPNDHNKVAVIIDHVKNFLRHGLPNANHDWSLNPNIKKKVSCPNCGKLITPITFIELKSTLQVSIKNDWLNKLVETKDDDEKEMWQRKLDATEGKGKLSSSFCPHCLYEFLRSEGDTPSNHEPERLNGELSELHVSYKLPSEQVQTTVKNKPNTIAEIIHSLIQTAHSKNYKLGWVAYNALEYAKSYEDCTFIADACGYRTGWAWHAWQQHLDRAEY